MKQENTAQNELQKYQKAVNINNQIWSLVGMRIKPEEIKKLTGYSRFVSIDDIKS